ncbi:MAG: hypothetical protein CMF25_00290 [Kangiellaceae bacterium]|nr:hypothetical protein [Kangiellaceae bacterium]
MCIAMLMFLCEYLGGWLVFQYNESFFQQAELYVPKKISVTMRIDEDILDWFKGQGQGYQTRINQLLRKYMDAHRH